MLLDWDVTRWVPVSDLFPKLRDKASRTSVIVLSARDDRESEIEALKAGADDFIRKPFDFEVLTTRIEAKLRFGGSNIIEVEDLVINPEEERIIYKGEEIELKGNLLRY